ncbi:MAG: SDR family NAD(P)-dependent oxidoreductase [bacterium]|nr:SDR family NAD(P)-dependent oxidoreductase [bacterium]MDE0501617.1 SDR family NAD(P)-dependent oxidoreductase [bacterium]
MTRPTAVITGAGRGIGLATALRFVEEGFHVLMADLDPAVIETAATLNGGRHTRGIVADVATAQGRRAIVSAMEERGGALAALVNNAGIVRDVRLVNMTDDEFAVVVGVNLGGAYQLTRQLVPFLGEGSAVVSISSRAYLGSFGQFNYTMSKGGLIGMTRALARQLAPQKIRVNIVAPGFTESILSRSMRPELRERLVNTAVLRRAAEPEEIADLISFLCSDKSLFITGQVMLIDGGRSL